MSHMKKTENIFRIESKGHGNVNGSIGWQFKMKRNGKQTTKFFSDSVHGSTENAFNAALEYKAERIKEVGAYSGEFLTGKISSKNTSGIIGVNRSESIRQKDSRIDIVWQCHSPTPEGQRIANVFSINAYGEIGALYKAVEKRLNDITLLIGAERYKHCEGTIRSLIDRYLSILVYLESVDDKDKDYLISILNNKKMPSTEKEQIITGRVGQSSYKEKLAKLWNNSCSVTGSNILLQASHIKPWAASTNEERLDPFNGLLLSPWYDKAFDNGYITFSDTGNIIFSNIVKNDSIYLTINKELKLAFLNEFTKCYLTFHRENIFKK